MCQVVFLALRSVNTAVQTHASLAADVLGVVAVLGAGLLSWFDHQRSIRPSSLLAVFLLFASVLDVARLRTLWSIVGAVGAATVFSLVLGLKVVALVLESISKYQSIRSPGEYDGVGSEPFSGLWTRIGYVWLIVTVRQGYRRILSIDDLPAIEPQLRSRVLHCQLEREWVTCEPCLPLPARSDADTWTTGDKTSKYSLLLACFRAYSLAFFSGVLPRLCLIGFTFAQPFMINTLTNWVQDNDASKSSGNGLIGAYGLVYLGMAVSYTPFRLELLGVPAVISIVSTCC